MPRNYDQHLWYGAKLKPWMYSVATRRGRNIKCLQRSENRQVIIFHPCTPIFPINLMCSPDKCAVQLKFIHAGDILS